MLRKFRAVIQELTYPFLFKAGLLKDFSRLDVVNCSEAFLAKHSAMIDWYRVTYERNYDVDFICKYRDNLFLSVYPVISKIPYEEYHRVSGFIPLSWYSSYMWVPLGVVMANLDEVDQPGLVLNGNYKYDFIREYFTKVTPNQLVSSMTLTEEELVDLIHTSDVRSNPNEWLFFLIRLLNRQKVSESFIATYILPVQAKRLNKRVYIGQVLSEDFAKRHGLTEDIFVFKRPYLTYYVIKKLNPSKELLERYLSHTSESEIVSWNTLVTRHPCYEDLSWLASAIIDEVDLVKRLTSKM